jgi:hypothetical protein
MSQSSFAKRWDQIAGQIGEDVHVFPSHPGQLAVHTVPTRPESTDTFHEAQLAFKDFDGVHFSPETEEYVELGADGEEIRRISARTSSGSLLDVGALLRSPPPKVSLGAPPPDENMVYYPAPVPRMLNLPKRLSQLPAATVQARRRTQLITDNHVGARQSAIWPSQTNLSDSSHEQIAGVDPVGTGENRRSMLNQRVSMANLPPQLRASVYFEHESIGQEVEVKSESAVATLDSILNASATAPVNAFTDHPFAGDVRKSVYASGNIGRRRTVLLEPATVKKDETKRRSNLGLNFRRSSTNLDGELGRPQSRSSLAADRTVTHRRSTYSLGDELERVAETEFSDSEHVNEDGEVDAHARHGHRKTLSAGDQIYHNYIEEEEEDEQELEEEQREYVEEEEVIYAAPSTLLAELQVRKAQQKSRSRTAATAFPNGMHSTLLQLDAVEEISKKNRKIKRVELAWEDPGMRNHDIAAKDADDEDVPLGMLYKPKNSKNKAGDGNDWPRPMGLMERRELEDNEPLSSRRSRLRGESPPRNQRRAHRQSIQALQQPTILLPKAEEEEDPSEANETLGQRAWRLKTKDKLDTAISDVAPKTGARPLSTFSEDVLGQFGGLDVADEPTKEGTANPSGSAEALPQEETLGQRRARLQREREASGEMARPATASPSRPVLRSNNSLADLLSANPVGTRMANKHAEPVHGTLLHANAQMQLKHKQDLSQQNFRSSSMLHNHPLVNANQFPTRDISGGGLLGNHASRPRNGGFAGGMYNHSGQPMPLSAVSSPTLGMNNTGYFSPPMEAMHFSPQQQPLMSPAAYSTMPAAAMVGAYGFGGMPYGSPVAMGMQGMMPMAAPIVDPALKPDQRNAIDRWRMGIDS